MEPAKICPNAHCQAPMVKQNHSGVTIDVCERDGAVALDNGELQLIISQVAGMPGFKPIPQQQFAAHRATYASGHGHHGRRHHGSSDGFFDSMFGSS